MIGMELFPDGKVRERDLDVYRSLLLFDTNEVLSHWPSEPIADGPDIESNGPISAFSITAKRSSNNSEVTTAWMEGFAIAFVSWGQKPKRDDAINTKTR